MGVPYLGAGDASTRATTSGVYNSAGSPLVSNSTNQHIPTCGGDVKKLRRILV
jgi:hypothetical protein